MLKLQNSIDIIGVNVDYLRVYMVLELLYTIVEGHYEVQKYTQCAQIKMLV